MNLILWIVVFDAAVWAFVLMRHALWLKNHPTIDEACSRINWVTLLIAAIMTCCFIIMLGIVWVWMTVTYGYQCILFITIAGSLLAVIHLFALIAHCTLLNVHYWPAISKCMSLYIVLPVRMLFKRHVVKNKNTHNTN